MAAFRRLPNLADALEGVVYFVFVLLVGGWAMRFGELSLDPVDPPVNAAMLALPLLLVPVLSEEAVFRSWLPASRLWPAAVSVAAFVLWHPLQVILSLPSAHPLFLTPGFLAVAAALGLVCTLSRIRSGSIWPAVLIHWGEAVIWRALFAGPG